MLKFQPILMCPVWGGEQIAPYKGLEAFDRPIGECWELSGLAGYESIVSEGPDCGRTLRELVAREARSWSVRPTTVVLGRSFRCW